MVPTWFPASLLRWVRAPSSAPFGRPERPTAGGRHTESGTTWRCRRCGAVAHDLAAARRHVAAMHPGETMPSGRPAARVVRGGACRHDPVPAVTETAFHDFIVHRCGRSLALRAPLALRLAVCLTRGRLDRQIAAGRPCDSSALLAQRARELVRRRTRARLAQGLRGVVAYADRDDSPRALSTVVIQRAAVRADREAILGLAERFEAVAPVSARGVALARAMLTDGVGSPLFNSHCELTVAEAAWRVAEALAEGASTSVFDVC